MSLHHRYRAAAWLAAGLMAVAGAAQAAPKAKKPAAPKSEA